MEFTGPYRPRVSRETRRLLIAGVLAVAALWLLARFRFEAQLATPNPLPAVLGQFSSRPTYADLAAEVVPLRNRLEASLLTLEATPVAGASQSARRLSALRIRDDVVVSLVPAGFEPDPRAGLEVLARDRASGLIVARTASQGPASLPARWRAGEAQVPRYLFATTVTSSGVSLSPIFVGSFDRLASAAWSAPLWSVGSADVTPGSFVFTSDAELAGLVVVLDGAAAIVPGETLVAETERLLASRQGASGTIGVQVQELTPSIAAVTGSRGGVVVTWVERDGPAGGQLMAGDVIEALDRRPLESRERWDVRLARILADDKLVLHVLRRGEVREVTLVARAQAPRPPSVGLGLTLRARAGAGAEVVRVEPGSVADRAGLAAGDVITLVDDRVAPTPAQVTRSFESSPAGRPVLVAVTRGDTHHVTTLER